MKGIFLLSCCLFTIICISQKRAKKELIPPGTVKINDTLYMDKYEVSNIGWREWLADLEQIQKDSIACIQALPDTTVWHHDGDLFSLSEYYFRGYFFDYFPVIGITYDQAIAFCKWRTYAANQVIYFKENKIRDHKKHRTDSFAIKFYYRLPTKQEWESIASASLDPEPFSSSLLYNTSFHNTKEISDSIKQQKHRKDQVPDFFLFNTGSFYPDKYGLYNMIGNAAEMVTEKGVSKGGSFIHPMDSCKIPIDQFYSNPERWLGFRCVAILLK